MKRWVSWLIALFVIAAAFGSLTALMRESDQASLLTGALDIAWGGDILGNAAYRYDKFYGTYWMLALLYKLAGVEVGGSSSSVVLMGNTLAAACYSLSLVWLVIRQKFSGSQLAVLFVALSSPVLMLSSSIISPNIFSVAWLLVMMCCLLGRVSRWKCAMLIVASFMAVACRADAVLVMPLCALAISRRPLLELWKESRVVCTFIGSTFALIVGRVVGSAHNGGIGETFFFEPKVGLAYMVFGLGAVLGMILLLALYLVFKKRLRGVLYAVVVLLPLAFYVGLLFSPRHLMLVPVALLATVTLPRGRVWWRQLMACWLTKYTVWIGVVVAALMLVLSIRMPEVKSPQLAMDRATCYPTADGYWPMAGTLGYMRRMASGASIPVDHNQEVWDSWRQYRFSDGQKVFKDSLFRYAGLAALLQGKKIEFTDTIEGAVFSERVLRREGSSVGFSREVYFEERLSLDFVGDGGLRVCRIGGTMTAGETERWLAAGLVGDGNDFLFVEAGDTKKSARLEPYLGQTAYLFSPSTVDASMKLIGGGKIPIYEVVLTESVFRMEEVSVAVRRLPRYMQVQSYGVGKK